MDRLFMQFLGELKDCEDVDAVRLVAREFSTLAIAEWEKKATAERQQPNEGPE